MATLLFLLLLCSAPAVIHGRGSVFKYAVDKTNAGAYMSFPNYLYKHSHIAVTILCDSGAASDTQIRVQWILQQMNCMEQMMNLQTQSQQSILDYVTADSTHHKPGSSLPASTPPPLQELGDYDAINFQVGEPQTFTCGDKHLVELKDESNSPYHTAYISTNATDNDKTKAIVSTNRTEVKNSTLAMSNRIVEMWEAGMYHFLLSVAAVDTEDAFTAVVSIRMGGSYGFMPANQWPILPYSVVLAVIYLVLGTVWVALWVRAHQHTLKIHMVIGAITVAGALCNTLMFVNMASLNTNGQIMESVVWLVELLAALQDSLMHLLFMVVSTGYGITRPTLSKDILGIMFTLTVISFLSYVGIDVVIDEKLQIKYTYPLVSLLVMIFFGIVLLAIGAFIVVMSGLTLVHLWKRKHSSNKIHVFAAFMLSSCVCFIVSVVLIGFANGFYTTCRTDWQHEWLYANFGHMVSCVMLVGVMWLWRPVDTLQSYAFLPLASEDATAGMGADTDDDDEVMPKDGKLAINMEAL